MVSTWMLSNNATTPIQAETGKGEDIFKVIMTIFGVDKSKGDVIAIVTANRGEVSKVKFLDSETPYVDLSVNKTAGYNSGGIMEYVATFPNITVKAGEEYKACVVTSKDLELICTTGNNSPASRPEIVDISLNATSGIEQLAIEEGDVKTEEEGNEEENGEGIEELSPRVLPAD